jgi:pimeloyl-ACP methyl ester carboxylesterase
MSVRSLTVDGLELLVAEPPAGTHGKPLLFVHGAFAGAWMWADNFLPYFAAAGYRAYALSLRGHGGSFGHDGIDWLSITDYLDDVTRVIAEIGEEPTLIGHSMGGFVVQKYLERFAVPAAVLLCSVPPQGLAVSQMSLLVQKPGLVMELNRILGGHVPNAAVVREALFAGEVPEAVLAYYLQHMQAESHRAIWDMSLFNLPSLYAVNLPPLLVLGAELDVLVPACMAQGTAATLGVPCHIFPAMGHAVTHEAGWQQVAAYIREWLDATLL